MRKVVFQMMTSLNGRVDDPGGWVGSIDDDQYSEINRLYNTFDTLLMGRISYDETSSYWPGAETEDSGSENNKSMARKMNRYKKYMITKAGEKETLDWNNSEHIIAPTDEDLIAFVNTLKAQEGGDIHIVGGARFAQSIVRLGLVDEYHFFVYPIVSLGKTWFDQVTDKPELDLISATIYQNGVVGLYYTPKKSV
jgi:dihydrofolate reductase